MKRWETFKRWLFLQGMAVLLCLLWLPIIYQLSQGQYGSGVSNRMPSNLHSVETIFRTLLFERLEVYLIVFGVGLAGFWRTPREVRSRPLKIVGLLGLWITASLLLAMIVNLRLASLYDRRVIFLLVGLVLMLGTTLTDLPRFVRFGLLGATFVIALIAPYPPQVHQNWMFRQTIQYMNDRLLEPGDAVFFQYVYYARTPYTPYLYYADRFFDDQNPFFSQQAYFLGDEFHQQWFANDIAGPQLANHDRFWIVQPGSDSPVPQNTNFDWVQFIDHRHFVEVERHHFVFSDIVLYQDKGS
jgi:hypothetical protein